MSKRVRLFFAAALLALLFSLPLLPLSKYQLHIANLVAVSAILAMSLDLLFGFLGQMSLAHASFYGVGAYVASLLTINGILPFWVATPVAMLACAALGALLGAPAMRLTGFYLAMATMSFGIIMSTLFVQSVSITGGPNGLLDIPPPQFLGTELIGPQRGVIGNYYYLLLASALLVYVFLRRVTSGRTGRTIAAVRESTLAAAAVGINVRVVQVTVFAVSCALAGLAGSLYAHLILYISPETFTFTNSLLALLGVVFGGIGTIWGPAVGAGILTVLGELTRNFGSYQLIMYAVAIVLVIQLVPHGISGLFAQLQRPASRRPAASGSAAPVDNVVLLSRKSPTIGGVLLRVTGISKRFGGLKALNDVSFDVKAGEIKALIGPNGSGKTTLFNCISGFETPNAGTVAFAETPVSGWPAYRIARAGMARSFQIVQLFGRLTVEENLLLAGQRQHPASVVASLFSTPGLRHADGDNARSADALLAEAGLSPLRDQISSTLPYGRQRILEIARALATNPRLILLDEPAAGLNTGEAFELATYLRRVRDRGVTVLVVEHNMAFVLGLADSVIVLDRGQKIADGTPAEIRKDEAVIAAYLGAPLKEARRA
jgi:ABC-type branched-subunit amino acid transport system ATPase component/ABC-type branched-subunit amino acid transport system permease subunit